MQGCECNGRHRPWSQSCLSAPGEKTNQGMVEEFRTCLITLKSCIWFLNRLFCLALSAPPLFCSFPSLLVQGLSLALHVINVKPARARHGGDHGQLRGKANVLTSSIRWYSLKSNLWPYDFIPLLSVYLVSCRLLKSWVHDTIMQII